MKSWKEIFFDWIKQTDDYNPRYEIYEQDFEDPEHIKNLYFFAYPMIPFSICKTILEEAESNRSLCENDERVMYRASEYFCETMHDEIDRIYKKVTMKKQLLENFINQYDSYYDEPENRQLEWFFKFADGKLTKLECDELLQQHYSDLSGECEREGFCE
jgi:hypothetical protein